MGRSQAKLTPFPPSFVAVTLNPYPSERTKSFTVIKFERNRTKASWSLERRIWPPKLVPDLLGDCVSGFIVSLFSDRFLFSVRNEP